MRTLTVAASYGLCNRLRVLLSGMALAEATGRRYTMLWPRTQECAAAFSDLFATPWPVTEATALEVERLRQTVRLEYTTPDLLTAGAVDLRIWSAGWLLAPDRFPAHGQLMQRSAELLALLQPVKELQERVEAFQTGSFRSHMIGVHLRRADMQLLSPIAAANTDCALSVVDKYLAQIPNAGILLCTDDGAIHQHTGNLLPAEGVRDKFLDRYHHRVIHTLPRSIDRREPEAIQDALVDLWLLRRTDCFVGTVGSSFSELAAFGRTVPVTLCQSWHPLRHLIPIRYWLQGYRRPKWLARYYWGLIRPRGARKSNR